MMFNLKGNGVEELRYLTGNYFANNDFNKVSGELDSAAEELKAIIGAGVYNKYAALYSSEVYSETEADIILMIQRPVAIMATLRLYQKNDLSHEDDGRKFKVASDDTEKLPWEWQLQRDDAIQLESYYRSIEVLLKKLNDIRPAEWIESDQYKIAHSLIIKSGSDFNRYFPIASSERMYILLMPYIREAQMRFIRPAFGEGYAVVISDDSVPETDLHYSACMATALLAMSIAFKRGPLQIIPHAVIKGYLADHGATSSEPASIAEVRQVSQSLELDARDWIEQMKIIRDGGRDEIKLIPDNNKNNKYFRT